MDLSTRPAVGEAALPDLVCVSCGRRHPVVSLAWRCGCGGLLDVAPFSRPLDLGDLPGRAPSLWRYAEALPLAVDPAVSLGEGLTPLVPSRLPGVSLKLDFLLPTLSFKDRGAVVLATLAARLGVPAAVVDSSGNAGTAAAAYLARAGVPCTVLVPEATSPAKLAQMRAHGATVRLVPGDRAATAAAARELAADPDVLYASHVHHPYFLHGVKTYGYEVWEQLGRQVPDAVVVPVGNGTLALGCRLAFAELHAAGTTDRVPRVVAVQAAGCAPLERAWQAGRSVPEPVTPGRTAAEGIAIADPPRGAQVLAAVRETGGTVVAVTDEEAAAARRELAADGLFVEPTAAVCWAAVRAALASGRTEGAWPATREALRDGRVVVPLCGAGLKVPGA